MTWSAFPKGVADEPGVEIRSGKPSLTGIFRKSISLKQALKQGSNQSFQRPELGFARPGIPAVHRWHHRGGQRAPCSPMKNLVANMLQAQGHGCLPRESARARKSLSLPFRSIIFLPSRRAASFTQLARRGQPADYRSSGTWPGFVKELGKAAFHRVARSQYAVQRTC